LKKKLKIEGAFEIGGDSTGKGKPRNTGSGVLRQCEMKKRVKEERQKDEAGRKKGPFILMKRRE